MAKRFWTGALALLLVFSSTVSATTYVPIRVGSITVIIPIDDPPVAVPDSFTVVEDTPTVLNVLANDSDENMSTVRVSIVNNPSHGVLELSPDARSITYTPYENSTAPDAFVYRLVDENDAASNDVAVLIDIQAVDDVPVFSSRRTETGSSYDAVFEYGTPRVDLSPLLSLTDVDDNLDNIHDYSLAPAGAGSLVKTTATDLRWDISDGFEGPAHIHVSVISGGTEYWYEFVYLVQSRPNTRPDIWGPGVLTVREGDNFTHYFSVYDAEGDDLDYSLQNNPSWGNYKIGYSKAGTNPFINSIGHKPGTYSLQYRVSDGRLVKFHPFTLVVLPASENAPPYFKRSPQTYVQQGSQYTYNPEILDWDGDAITLAVNNLPSWLNFNSTTGALTGFAATEGTFSNISITATAAGQTTTIGPFDLTVVGNPVYQNNNAPIAMDDSINVIESDTVTIDVLRNDSDPDGDPITISGATVNQGNVQITNGGTQLTYTAPADATDTLNLTYSIGDGKGGQASANVHFRLEKRPLPKPPRPTGLNVSVPGTAPSNQITVLSGTKVLLEWTNPDLSSFSGSNLIPVVHYPDDGLIAAEGQILARNSGTQLGAQSNDVAEQLGVTYVYPGHHRAAIKLCYKTSFPPTDALCGDPSNYVDIHVTSLSVTGLAASPTDVRLGRQVTLSWNAHNSSVIYYLVEEAKPNPDGSAGSVWEPLIDSTSDSQASTTPSTLGTHKYRVTACIASTMCGEPAEVSITVNNKRVVFIHTDLLGSPAAETNENGEVQ